ncbi:O-antigen ligase family protein [Alteromonas sp. ASW11-19]|uniref:O-antigen ligase family protein n=1 Tax=Alteromonas salexigens TaxID=2982530 RepID=A0ABT2VJ03_9ALTE|nr:O-antigen ligase family protein [Alteromonas salexigens]MCU7553160.1 O-antigen ligase family protein [Alteromonas salexigens]
MLASLLVVAPWLHGGELVWEQMTLVSLIFLTMGFAVMTRPPAKPLRRNVQLALIAGTCWVLYNTLSLLPLDSDLLSSLSPAAAQWYELTPGNDSAYLSVYWYATALECLKYLALVALIPTLLWLVRTPQAARRWLHVCVGVATVTALYGLLNFFSGGLFELSAANPPWDLPWQDGIRGPYSYKNQYAIYLVMTLPLALVWCARQYRVLFSPTFIKHNNRRVALTRLAIVVIMFLCLIFTLLNTSSRGALLALMVSSAAVTGGHLLRYREQRQRWLNKKVILGGVIAAGLLAVLFTQSAAFDRFKNDALEDNGRLQLHSTALEVIKEYPLTGSGAGTYPYVQHQYKPPSLGNSGMSQRVHNDYLETLATQGIAGTVLLAIMLGALISGMFGRSHSHGHYQLACRCAVLALLIQSVYDVNVSTFWLPVYAITLCVLAQRFRDPAPGK